MTPTRATATPFRVLRHLVSNYFSQVLVAGSRDFQSRKTAEGIKACRLTPPKVGPGIPGFVDRPKLLDADALRAEVESRYNPTLLVHGERGSGKTVAVRLALHGVPSVVHVKLWAQDLDRPLKALAQAIIDASGAEVTLAPALVAEAALRRLKGSDGGGGALAPIVVVELDKRCTAPQLMGVLLAAKRWGDDENLAKFVVEASSARIARGLSISLSDLRVEGVKVGVEWVSIWQCCPTDSGAHRGGLLRRGATRPAGNYEFTVLPRQVDVVLGTTGVQTTCGLEMAEINFGAVTRSTQTFGVHSERVSKRPLVV